MHTYIGPYSSYTNNESTLYSLRYIIDINNKW